MHLIKTLSIFALFLASQSCLSQERRFPTASCVADTGAQDQKRIVKIMHTGSIMDVQVALTDAYQSGFSGATLLLEAEIDKTGVPTSVSLINPTKYEKLNNAAVTQVKLMTFEPGICNKVKIPMILQNAG